MCRVALEVLLWLRKSAIIRRYWNFKVLKVSFFFFPHTKAFVFLIPFKQHFPLVKNTVLRRASGEMNSSKALEF